MAIVSVHATDPVDRNPDSRTLMRVLDDLCQGSTGLFVMAAGLRFHHVSRRFEYQDDLGKTLATVLISYVLISAPGLAAVIARPAPFLAAHRGHRWLDRHRGGVSADLHAAQSSGHRRRSADEPAPLSQGNGRGGSPWARRHNRRPMTTSDSPVTPRPIRSFVVRAGRMGSGQKRALEQLSGRYVVPYAEGLADWTQQFGRSAPRILEIGFGMGQATAEIAAARPMDDFIGVEVHPPGVGALLQRIEEQSLTNVRILQHDAVEVLQHMVAPASLAGVHIYFPDPWHKKRHNKRRLVQPPFVALLASRLAPGAYVHCATDWQPYAEQMLAVLSASAELSNTVEGYAPRPDWRPPTKFENRGLKLGHGVWDLIYTRR